MTPSTLILALYLTFALGFLVGLAVSGRRPARDFERERRDFEASWRGTVARARQA